MKSSWIKKYLDIENSSSWKIFFDLELFLGNLNRKDVRCSIKVSDPFIKEILEIWSDALASLVYERKNCIGDSLPLSTAGTKHELIADGRDDAVVRALASHQCGPGSIPGSDSSRTRRHMWVEFVVGSRPCSEQFFSGYSGFPLFSKTNTYKFQFDLESVPN